MAIQDIKSMNDFFRQILQKNLTKAINPQPTTAPTVPVKNYVGDLGARPQMTNPDMKELKFEASTSPWSALLVGLGLQNKMKNQTGLTNEQLAQSDYTDKFKTANDMNQYNQKKQSDLDFDAVDPNKIADREFKQGQILNQGWDSFLQGEKAPLEMQKLQASVDNIGKGSASAAADAQRKASYSQIFEGLKQDYMAGHADPVEGTDNFSDPTRIPYADLEKMHNQALLLSNDPKLALRARPEKAISAKTDTLPFRQAEEARRVEKFNLQKKTALDKESDQKQIDEIVGALQAKYPTVAEGKQPWNKGTLTNTDPTTGAKTQIDRGALKNKLEQGGYKIQNINKAMELHFK